jgi:hypothetical protein
MTRKPLKERVEFFGEVSEEDLKKFAKDAIQRYFSDKTYYCGGPIPQCELIGDSAAKTVLKTKFDDRTFDFIHAQCLPLIAADPMFKDPTLTWPVHCLLEILEGMRSREVPIEFQPGMVLLYFKFCLGVDIPKSL